MDLRTMLHAAAARRNPFALSRPEAALVAITMVWGATFLVVQIAMREGGAPFAFVGLRFAAAGLATLLLFWRAMRGLTLREVAAGGAIGLCIFLGFSLQTVGLQTISSSRSAFITAVYVPLVPLLQVLVLRRPPHPMAWAGVALATVGLVLVAGPQAGGGEFGVGEAATLLGAVAIAAEIILIGRFAGTVDVRRITVVQLLTASGLAFLLSPAAGETLPASGWWLAAAVALGLASAVIQLTINWAQRTVSPTRATVIYAGEPVWGGVVGRLAGDRLPALALIGGALIVAAVLVSEWRPRRAGAPGRAQVSA
ncbi:DMT family transporter [Amaricoccus sp.]|uniref:DMT family transporter n=1 Tax=Amaricoccus sp. TaxID=1872485 RepID=UPI0025B8C8CE|nr:DMT family transporter [Amaricoccus sp.]